MKEQFYLWKHGMYFIIFLLANQLSAQMNITGTVTGAADNLPLIGASINVQGTSVATITDIDGKYTIVASSGDVLVFSYLGMQEQKLQVGDANVIDLEMKVATILDEVIITAYGTSKKGSFTGSATQIDAKSIENRALTNISSAIEGAPGIQYSPGNGQPGSSSPIRVRGFGSVNASSDPLYVVDGIIFSGQIASINPNDIESITVLKDAASTALYGSKAANGVILLTTKQGSSGGDKFNLNISKGFSGRAIPEYERVSAEQYYPLVWEAYRNSLSISGNATQADANQTASNGIFDLVGTNPFNVPNNQIVGTDGQLNPSAQLLYADDLDWQDELMRRGDRTVVDLSYQGSNKKTNYFASLSYLDDQAWILNSDFERISGRININTTPNKWIKTGVNIYGSTSTSNQAADGGSTSFVNPFFSTRNIAPIYPVFEHDPTSGALILDDNGNPIYDLGDNRVGNTNGRHAIQETILNIDNDRNSSLNARAFVDINFTNDLKLTVNGSLDRRFFHNEDFDNPIVGDGAPAGRAGRDDITISSVTYNQLLTYSKDFGDHSFTALAGHESFEYERNALGGFKIGLIASGNTELINFTQTSDLSSNTRKYSTEGYLGRLEYDFADKYFLSGSFRRDGSSRFAKDVRWGNFWSVGGAWRIDQESFVSGIESINALKLRASYGEVGNDSNLDNGALSFFASQPLFALDNNNDLEAGILISTLGSATLEWESNAQTDIALEFSLFDYKVTGSVEYYNRITDNLLFEVPLPLSTGLDDFNDNIGSMFNRGIELNLAVDLVRRDDFTWNVSANTSTIHNEFTELPQEEIINGSKKLVVGGSIYDYWLRDWYGVDPADGAALYIVDEEVDPSDASIRTVDGVMVTTDHNDAKFDFVGTAVPDFFGSFQNTFVYKGFRLGLLFTYQIGGQTYDTNWANLMTADYGESYAIEVLDRWQKPGDVTNVPRLDAAQLTPFGAGSDRWLVDSDFLALRQINIGYEIPEDFTKSLGLRNARVFANGENIFINTKRQGMDVNQNFNGTTQNRFTPSRTITLGLNVDF
jgi:TonB-linked SusC/RagA family outer membrane protein